LENNFFILKFYLKKLKNNLTVFVIETKKLSSLEYKNGCLNYPMNCSTNKSSGFQIENKNSALGNGSAFDFVKKYIFVHKLFTIDFSKKAFIKGKKGYKKSYPQVFVRKDFTKYIFMV